MPAAPNFAELDRIRRQRKLAQGAEVEALAAAHRRVEPSDFGSLDHLSLPLLLALLGSQPGEHDLLLELLAALEEDLHLAHVIATNEDEPSPGIAVEWTCVLRPIRIRARVIHELRRREVAAALTRQRDAAAGAALASSAFDEAHLDLCELLNALDAGRTADPVALRTRYEAARAIIAMAPQGVDDQAILDARGLAFEIGRRLDRLQRREHRHAEDLALLTGAPALLMGAA